MTQYPHEPPSPPPSVLTWYKAYCIAMAVMYLAVSLFAMWYLREADVLPEGPDAPPPAGLWMMLVLSLGLMAVFAAPLAFPPRPWVWVYGIVMIAIGMTSACCLPATIPLLIFWIKPQIKQYFGRAS